MIPARCDSAGGAVLNDFNRWLQDSVFKPLEDKKMPVMEHLVELQVRLTRAVIATAVVFVGTFFYADILVKWLRIPLQNMPLALTVEENLWVVARLYGLSDIKRRVDEIVKKLEMQDFRLKITRKLSSGQMTRLTLAKAFLTEPKILFLDEPTASLDPDIAHKIRALLKEERRSAGLSILYTSHNMKPRARTSSSTYREWTITPSA